MRGASGCGSVTGMTTDSIPRRLDLDAWPRRAQYDWFRRYELPFFNICAEVDVSATWALCKAAGASFDLACWYGCQRVIDGLEPFRYRLRPDGVVVHARVGVAMTRAQGETFVFCHVEPADDFAGFVAAAEAQVERQTPGAPLDARPERDDVIHGTTLPWLRFTGLSHARRFGGLDSVPKIAFGRCTTVHGRTMMPLSVEVHHALMDGVHVAQFFRAFEAQLAAPESWLA